MSRISPAVQKIIAEGDGKVSTVQAQELVDAVKKGTATTQDVAAVAQRYGDLFDAGAAAPLASLKPAQAKAAVFLPPVRSLGDDVASAAVLRGDDTLSPAPHKVDPAVREFQRALNALANRTAHPEYALLGSGADGAFGPEMTRAVTAFQKANGLPATGTVDRSTAVAIEEQLYANAPPDVGGITEASALPDGQAIADAARKLIDTQAVVYGVAPEWKSPNPKIPGNVDPGVTPLGATDHWKCNLFGLDSLYVGGAKPPTYPGGDYPIAVEIPDYSRGEHPPLLKLGEVDTAKVSADETQARVTDMLRIARPGDLIIVRHQGDGGVDGGHTRVVLANHYAADQQIDTAEAGEAEAHILTHGVSDFTGEAAIYLLRPNERR